VELVRTLADDHGKAFSTRADGSSKRVSPGLVGSAIEHTINHETVGSRFGKFAEDDKWVFLSSKDGDLRRVPFPLFLAAKAIFERLKRVCSQSSVEL
jgi:hypothetical protein